MIAAPMKITCPFCNGRTANCVDMARHLIQRHNKQLCVCSELNFIRSPLESKVWALAEHLHEAGDAEAHLNYHLLAATDCWVMIETGILKAGGELMVRLPGLPEHYATLANSGLCDEMVSVYVHMVNGKYTGEWTFVRNA